MHRFIRETNYIDTQLYLVMIRLGLWVIERKARDKAPFSSHPIKGTPYQQDLRLTMLAWVT